MSLKVGQLVRVNLFGMRLPGLVEPHAVGTVVELEPGVITVRVRRGDGEVSDVTVSPGRIER